MKSLGLFVQKILCVVITLALSSGGAFVLPLRADDGPNGKVPRNRDRGKPVVITFGQPNIWSLDQAHYLLSQLRERSLNFQAEALADLDPNETHGTRVSFMRQIFELAAQFTQPITSGSPEPSPTNAAVPEGTPERVAAANMLDGTILGKLLANPDFQKRLFSDPKLNAVTKLDNHIQLQYEIIARQLTLLRDEVRPGERLVFLELPQSIYTTDDKADNKIAQVWWQVDGFRLYDRLGELQKGINLANQKAAEMKKHFPELAPMTTKKCGRNEVTHLCEREDEQCRQRREDCRAYEPFQDQYEALKYWEESANDLNKKLIEEKDEDARLEIQRLRQAGPRPVLAEEPTPQQENGAASNRNFIEVRANDTGEKPDFKHTRVRTVDIIPHQSSLNVNDVQETVKSNFFSGAFSFLFGLGARTSFQRQRDQFEQFLHQELYASGFGKGDSLFGWTFGPLPGTKRVAPGLRTTFAALVLPARAESITMRARGCFFHRKDHQPPNGITVDTNSDWWDNNDRECGVTQNYRLFIPSGGGTENFWIDGIQYIPYKEPGDRMVAVIKGQNFTTQIGVLINGVPLKHVVEVTRKLPRSIQNNVNRDCPAICGEYEVVGPNDISIAFEMQDKFVGTPEITVVGPGRSVSLKHLPIRVEAFGAGRYPKLSESPAMFGDGPTLRIADVRLFRAPNDVTLGVLRGNNKLTQSAEVFINGNKLTNVYSEAALGQALNTAYFDQTKRILRIRFAKSSDEKLDVFVVDGKGGDTRTVANPFAEAKKPPPLAVTDDSILAYDAAAGEMAVRLTGTGLAKVTLQVLRGASPESEITSQSATELILRLVQPKVAVRIKLTDPNTGEDLTRAIVRRTPPRAVTEKRDTIDTKN